ncbi:[citrate (pro-3S)-lyase] ligase [Treponema primitia]|uniref:[citrate (pro-3S)-lyase] ligase n=1 Tax=Treponema primitia TaxID=88058 RepID=UPI003980B7EF
MSYLQKIRNPDHNLSLSALLAAFDLTLPQDADDNLGLYEGDELIGCGFLKGNMIQGLAIDGQRQGEGLSAALVTGLINLAARRGIYYLRVITKPSMAPLLAGLGLKVVADAAPYAVFLEFGGPDAAAGMEKLRILAADKPEGAACLVMNCNPFTKGHRWLMEQASRENPWVWVLAVEEDRSAFPFKDRLRLMEEGAADLKNVRVIPGGEYVISSLTFPAYFTRDADLAAAQGAMDAAIFAALIAPALRIRRRYVGTEPFSPSTGLYNRALRERLPPQGIELIELPRIKAGDREISASAVREGIQNGDWDLVRRLVPDTTWVYLRRKFGAE